MPTTTDDVPEVDAALAGRLVAHQFPHWAGLPVRPVPLQGWDNRTFRLGDALSVRLPSAAGYEPQVLKEHRWLPHLARHVPLPVPQPVALGEPALGYPFAWSVYGWLDGEVLAASPSTDLGRLATDLGAVLVALRAAPAGDGPGPGLHTGYRGGPLARYAPQAREAFATLDPADAVRAEIVLAEALSTRWTDPPVWFHGDVSAGNLLVRDGALAALLDFGCTGVGDPACDLVIGWTTLDDAARAELRTAVDLDDDTWARGRGWALWKAAILLEDAETSPSRRVEARRTLAAVLADAPTS